MRQFFTLLAASACLVAFGQKPNLNKAKAAFDKGELAEAKTIIDQATTYEKTMDKARTWYLRGAIYTSLDTANNEDGALETAVSSYKKALELDPEQKQSQSSANYQNLLLSGLGYIDYELNNYYGYYYNKGIQGYQTEDYAGAVMSFERAAMIQPADSNAVLNAAYAASAAEMHDKAKTFYIRALENGSTEKSVYLRLYNYTLEEKDLDQGLKYIRMAREVYPDEVLFQKYEINILIQQDKIDEARDGIEEAIKLEPDNPDLHFSLGVIKEQTEDLDGARESYKKAIEADENHFNSNFNLGVLVFNEGNELIKERNGLSYKEEKRFDELSKIINEKLDAALPYWEKLYSIDSDDETVLETLKFIYSQLKMNDKALQMADELDAVRGE